MKELSARFTKLDSEAVKGIALIMLLIHHLFYSVETIEGLTVIFSPLSEETAIGIAQAFKICVPIFVFLSVYGITKQSDSQLVSFKKSANRAFQLWANFLFIFIIAFIVSLFTNNPYGFPENGILGVLCAIIDMFGMAELFHTPTMNPTWWYMTLAYTIVFITPLFIKTYEKIGKYLILVFLFIPRLLGLNALFTWYALTIVLAVVCAKNNIFERYIQSRVNMFLLI
ncbi:MAG: heparan-alpha-glucosaminide N-acetyltransferase domain-containing protein [Christensenellaceae bacterium]